MSFVTAHNWYLFIPVAFLISSLANAGFVISVLNRRYELMPKENRIAYDNFYTAAAGLGFILGPAVGGLIKGAVKTFPHAGENADFTSMHILYSISTVGILVLQIIYLYIQKQNKHEIACSSVKPGG